MRYAHQLFRVLMHRFNFILIDSEITSSSNMHFLSQKEMKSSLFFDMKGLTVSIQSGLFLQGWAYDYQFMFFQLCL